MMCETLFYQAVKDKEFRIFLDDDGKYMTKITDSEYTEHKTWDYFRDAQSYIMDKMEETENKE